MFFMTAQESTMSYCRCRVVVKLFRFLLSSYILIWIRKNLRGTAFLDGKGKAIPVTGHGGPQGSETMRFPHFLDSRLTDGGEVVSPTRRLPVM
jgi:hypothetical protein